MKKIRMTFAAVLATASFIATSCSSDDGGAGGGSNLDTYISAKVDGQTFTTFSAGGVAASTAIRSADLIQVTATSMVSATATDTKTLAISLFGVTAPGTYQVGPNSDNSISYVEGASFSAFSTNVCAGATGTITVTTINDTKIEGTFSFTGKNDDNCSQQRVVTEGQFRGTF